MGSTADLPSPVPVIDKVLLNGSGETACIDICGKHFTSNLKVNSCKKHGLTPAGKLTNKLSILIPF